MEYSGKMISSLPVELILSCCQYLPYIDIEQLALTDRRLLHIIKKYLPLDLTPRISVNTFKIHCWTKVYTPPWFWGLWYEGVIKENRRYDDDTQGHEKLIYTNFHEIRLMYRKDTATVNPKRLDINIYPLRVFGLPTRKTWSNPVQIFVTYLLVYPWYIPKILGQSDLQQGIYEFFLKVLLTMEVEEFWDCCNRRNVEIIYKSERATPNLSYF